MNGLGLKWRGLARWMLLLWVIGAIALPVSAKYLVDDREYADSRFIVKLFPDVGDLAPVLTGRTVGVADAELTRLNQTWGVIKVERLFVGEPPKESPVLDLPGYWRFWLDKPVDLETLLSEFAAAGSSSTSSRSVSIGWTTAPPIQIGPANGICATRPRIMTLTLMKAGISNAAIRR